MKFEKENKGALVKKGEKEQVLVRMWRTELKTLLVENVK